MNAKIADKLLPGETKDCLEYGDHTAMIDLQVTQVKLHQPALYTGTCCFSHFNYTRAKWQIDIRKCMNYILQEPTRWQHNRIYPHPINPCVYTYDSICH